MRESLNMTKAEAKENLYRWLGDTTSIPRPTVYSIWTDTSRSGNRTYRFLTFPEGWDGRPCYLSRSIAALLGMPMVATRDGEGIRRSYLDPAEVVAELAAKLYGDKPRTPNAYKQIEHVSL